MGKKNTGMVDREGGRDLAQQPFGALDLEGLSPGPALAPARSGPVPDGPARRLEIRREKKGRAGKTVTVITGFAGEDARRVDELAFRLRRRCGSGGTSRGGSIELQGDQREEAVRFLREEGFCPVLSGG